METEARVGRTENGETARADACPSTATARMFPARQQPTPPVIIDQRNCGSRLSADRSRIYRTKSPFSFRISVHISSVSTEIFSGGGGGGGRSRARYFLSLPTTTTTPPESLLSFPMRRDTLFRSPSPLSPYFFIRLPTSRHGDQLTHSHGSGRLLVTYVSKRGTNRAVDEVLALVILLKEKNCWFHVKERCVLYRIILIGNCLINCYNLPSYGRKVVFPKRESC